MTAQVFLASLHQDVCRRVALLAAEVIEGAAAMGDRHWGVTPYRDGLRVNVGWTEVLTVLPTQIRLVVAGDLPRRDPLPDVVTLVDGANGGSYYQSIPGSVLAVVPIEPASEFDRAVLVLRPALADAVRVAARRAASRGVKAGHSEEALRVLASLAGRDLPSPSYARGSATDSSERGAALMEGALRRVVSSRYERNADARRACLAHYGTSCIACGFSFEAAFGPHGRGFIHVHHLTPLSFAGTEYAIDPVAHLRPVCPNCHAMLHSKDPPLSIDELRDLLQANKDA